MQLSLLPLPLLAVTLLSGCGGGGDDPAVPSSTTPAATTTTTTWKEPDNFVCKEGADAACAEYLNSVYMSYDEQIPSSALGVPMRGRPSSAFEEPWYFCSGECFRGQPDCYVPGSLLNHKIMINKNNKITSIMDDTLYVIFQPKTALDKLIKCAWQYDGAAFNRLNGGCGNGAAADPDDENVCQDERSAFHDKCPDSDGYADDNCTNTMQAWCGTEETDYPTACFWKGPAWFSPVYPGASPDMDHLDEVNEMQEMMKQRLKGQSFDKETDDGTPLTEYWNEITMDGRIIEQLLDQDPSQVVAAFGYVKGDDQAKAAAVKYKDDLGVGVPILALDFDVDISKTGPFQAEDGPSNGPSSGPFDLDPPLQVSI